MGMFVGLFHSLKRRGVPVTFNEWLLLQHALSENLMDSSLTRFYHLARAILVKTEAHFDKYDQAFLECFGHIESDEDLIRAVEERLAKMPPLELTEEEKRMVEQLSLEEVRARFLDQLKNQDDELHVGGNRAIGVRGRSTHGAWGYNPAGIRIEQHEVVRLSSSGCTGCRPMRGRPPGSIRASTPPPPRTAPTIACAISPNVESTPATS